MIKNRAELDLPLLDEKMVVAHYMTMMTYSGEAPPSEDLFNPLMYSPDGPSRHIGGMNQHVPMVAHYHGQAPLEENVAREIEAAIACGVDGFQFYLPARYGNDADREMECRVIIAFLRVAARSFPGFKLTVCPSHPNEHTMDQNIESWARSLNRVLDETRDLESWLKTPDGRTIVYLWCPDALADSVSPHDLIAKKPWLMKDVAEAYETLAEACGIDAAYIYHLRDEWTGNEALLEEALDYFPAIWGFIPTSDPHDDWGRIRRRCLERGRIYTQSVFNDFYTSKFYKKSEEFEMIFNLEECLDGNVEDYWKRYIACDLSRSFRRQLARAVEWDVPLINVVTWNDYPEGHHMAPEINRNFGFALLLKHFKNEWLGHSAENRGEWAATFFNKYRSDVRPSPFDFEVRPVREERADEDYIEVVTHLKRPASLEINGLRVGRVEAGLRESRVPSMVGQVRVRLSRDDEPFIEFLTPEGITDRPYRTDLTTYTFSSEFDAFFRRLFPGEEPIHSTEYANEKPAVSLAGNER